MSMTNVVLNLSLVENEQYSHFILHKVTINKSGHESKSDEKVTWNPTRP